MGLNDALKKAAAFFVEFEEDELRRATHEDEASDSLEMVASSASPVVVAESGTLVDALPSRENTVADVIASGRNGTLASAVPVGAMAGARNGITPNGLGRVPTPPAELLVNGLGETPPTAKTSSTPVETVEKPKTSDAIVALPVPTINSEQKPLSDDVLLPGGGIDFTSIYRQAELPAAPFSAEQAIELLSSLPADLPVVSKRQMVQVTIQAMGKFIGVTPETIVSDASNKLAALAAFREGHVRRTETTVSAAEAEINALMAQIEAKESEIKAAKAAQNTVAQSCGTEHERLDEVVKFFHLDTPAAK